MLGDWLNFTYLFLERLQSSELNFIQREGTAIIISWKLLMNRNDIKNYEIQYKAAEDAEFNKVMATTNGNTDNYKLENLKGNTLYMFRVRAVDVLNERGPWLEGSFNLNHGIS